MSKWTPGPWLVAPDGLDAFRVKSEDFGGVAYLHDPLARGMDRSDEIAANARLIAAAPEMAELLEKASKHMAIQHKGLIAEIETLIARINGESQ